MIEQQPDSLAQMAANEANKEFASKVQRQKRKSLIDIGISLSSSAALAATFLLPLDEMNQSGLKIGLLAYAAAGIGFKAANLVSEHYTPTPTRDEVNRAVFLEYDARLVEAIRQRDEQQGDPESYQQIITGNWDNKTSPGQPW